MTPLRQAATDYLALRRALGFKLRATEDALIEFTDFLDRRGATTITAAAAVESAVAADVTRLEYPGCAANAPVILYRIEQGGHTWPGGTELPQWLVGPTSHGIDASRAMWEFFREHPLAR